MWLSVWLLKRIHTLKALWSPFMFAMNCRVRPGSGACPVAWGTRHLVNVVLCCHSEHVTGNMLVFILTLCQCTNWARNWAERKTLYDKQPVQSAIGHTWVNILGGGWGVWDGGFVLAAKERQGQMRKSKMCRDHGWGRRRSKVWNNEKGRKGDKRKTETKRNCGRVTDWRHTVRKCMQNVSFLQTKPPR